MPLEVADEPTLEIENQANNQTFSLAGVKVLLAEDNKVNQLVAKRLLEKAEADVTIANNGSEAITRYSQQQPDIILMDMQMPVMDGLTATEHLRRELEADIPILALTANSSTADKEACIESGMNDVLTKPIDNNVLLARVGFWMQNGVNAEQNV